MSGVQAVAVLPAPSRVPRTPPKFENISKNNYTAGVARIKKTLRDEIEVCGCARAKGEALKRGPWEESLAACPAQCCKAEVVSVDWLQAHQG